MGRCVRHSWIHLDDLEDSIVLSSDRLSLHPKWITCGLLWPERTHDHRWTCLRLDLWSRAWWYRHVPRSILSTGLLFIEIENILQRNTHSFAVENHFIGTDIRLHPNIGRHQRADREIFQLQSIADGITPDPNESEYHRIRLYQRFSSLNKISLGRQTFNHHDPWFPIDHAAHPYDASETSRRDRYEVSRSFRCSWHSLFVWILAMSLVGCYQHSMITMKSRNVTFNFVCYFPWRHSLSRPTHSYPRRSRELTNPSKSLRHASFTIRSCQHWLPCAKMIHAYNYVKSSFREPMLSSWKISLDWSSRPLSPIYPSIWSGS